MAPSPPDVVSIVADIDARLAELEPLIEEHAKLTAARAELTGDGPALARPAGRPAARSARARRPAAGRWAPRGANRAAILAYVAEHSGATVAQIADATGIAKPTLHSTVSQLKRRGDLIAAGRGVKTPQVDAPARARARARRARSKRRAARRAAARRRAARRPAATPIAQDRTDSAAPAGSTDGTAVPSPDRAA